MALRHPNAEKPPDVLISKHLRVPRTVVRYCRKKLSCQSCQDSGTRTVTHGESTYELDVTNLGRRRRAHPRRDLHAEIEKLRDKAPRPAQDLLNVIDKWARGQVLSTRFLVLIENILMRRGDLTAANGSTVQAAKIEAVH